MVCSWRKGGARPTERTKAAKSLGTEQKYQSGIVNKALLDQSKPIMIEDTKQDQHAGCNHLSPGQHTGNGSGFSYDSCSTI